MSARKMGAPTLWTPEEDALLRQLWAEGHSTAEIGRRMGGKSKNMIIGRAGRIGCPRRDNPMLARTPAVRPTRAKAVLAHLPRAIIEKPQAGVLPALAPRVAPSAPSAASGQPSQPSLWRRCQWPTGHKDDTGIRFLCTDAPLPGKPYCGAHCAVAYVPQIARRAA